MTKKKIEELMEEIHKMDDVKLLMEVVARSRAEAVADYLMHPQQKAMSEELAIYMGQMLGRLDAKMIKRPEWSTK